jgi:hypothetical protein
MWLRQYRCNHILVRNVSMARLHLFEFVDLPWYPQTFRQMQTDYLQFSATMGAGHQNLIPLFKKALQQAGTTEILDLCSGGSGPWLRLQEQLAQAGLSVSIQLSDKFPNPKAIQKWAAGSHQSIEYLSESVDAMQVPSHFKGMRTLFEGFHHFKPEQARSILKDAAENRVAIGIFEASMKPPLGWLLVLFSPVITPLTYFLITPILTPRTLSRFFWTYLVPLVPLATIWDGIISMLRVYSPAELKKLTASIPVENYIWEIGQASTGTPIFTFTYLVGYPVQKAGKA